MSPNTIPTFPRKSLQVANATPVRLGQINEAGDVDALFLKRYAGEVLAAFAEVNKFADRTMVRNIDSGR